MNRQDKNYQKLYHYSIRKRNWGVGSVVVGVFLAGILQAPTVLANSEVAEGTANSVVLEQPQSNPDTAVSETAPTVTPEAVANGNEVLPSSDGDANSSTEVNNTVEAAQELVNVRVAVDQSFVEATSTQTSESGVKASNAVDNNAATFWSSNHSQPNQESSRQTLTVKLQETATVSKVLYTPRQDGDAAVGNVVKGKIQYSLDNVEWQDAAPSAVKRIVDSVAEGSVDSAANTFTLNANMYPKYIEITPVEALYVRLVGLETKHWNSSEVNKVVSAAEFMPYAEKQVPRDSVVYLDPALTSAPSFNETDGGGRNVAYATDGNKATLWASADTSANWNRTTIQPLTVGLTEVARVSSIDITPRQDGPNYRIHYTGDLISGYIEYLNAEDVWTRVSIIGGNQQNEFVFGGSHDTKTVAFTPVEAQKFRIVATNTHHWSSGNNNTVVAIAEVYLTGTKIETPPSTDPVAPPSEEPITPPAPDTGNPEQPGQPDLPIETPEQPGQPDTPIETPEVPGTPAETPQTTPATVEDQEVTLENDHFSRRMVVEDGKLRTVSISNKLTTKDDDIVFLEDSKEFVIQFKPLADDSDQAPTRPAYEAEAADRADWTVETNTQANAGSREGNVNFVVDGDPNTIWHSNYHSAGSGPQRHLPAYVDLTFQEPKEVRTFIYVPRQDGPANVNGLTKGYKVYVKEGDAAEFTLLTQGTITENPKAIQYIDFGEVKQNIKAIRFETTSSQNGQPFAAAAELDVSNLAPDAIRAKQLAREADYQKRVEAFLTRTQISLDKLTLAENGIQKVVTDTDQTITYTFQPYTYKNVPVTIKYVMNLKKDAKFSQSHLVISVPEEHRATLAIDTIDLQNFKLPEGQAYEEFSRQEPIAEMANFDGFHAGLGQPVYMGSFYTGSEFPISWNSVDASSNQLFSRYYSGKTLAELDLDAEGNYHTWNTVIGVARSEDYSVVQQDFYDYIAKIGTKTYFRKQYNSWYDLMKTITAENIQSSFNEIDRGFTNGGVSPLDSFVVDDGWQNIESVWDFNEKFPNKLYDSSKQVKRFGSDFGLWMGPRGGYGTEGRMATHLANNGLGSKTPAGDVYIGDKRYVDALKELFEHYGQEFDINYWKLDGMLRYPQHTTDTAGNYIGGGYKNMYSMTETHERWIELYNFIRENAPTLEDAWINLTSYIPPSPWFLQWVNSIWMQNTADVDYQDGVKRAPYDQLDFGNDANEALSYRDDSYEKLIRQRKWQIPFSNIYNHDPVYGATAHSSKRISPLGPARSQIQFSTEDFRTYLYMLGTRGTGFWEFYYSPSMLDDAKWQVNGEAVKWIESNFETLRNSVFHGGQPRAGHVYGYSAWDAENGIVSIRNPINTVQTYELKLDRIVGMREGTENLYRVTVLGDKRHDTHEVTNYGDTLSITLQPYEAVVFQYSTKQDTRAAEVFEAKATAANTITVEFDERVIIDEATTFTVSGHTVSTVQLNDNLRTVTLTLADNLIDREKVTVTYANVKDNAGQANLSTGTVALTAYSGGIIQDISQVDPSQTLANEGVEGRGVFSVTAKVSLDRLEQTIAEQEGQWKLSVDASGRAVFEVKGEVVKSAPFTNLSEEDNGRPDKLIAANEEVVITAVRVPNGSLRIYINGELHNSHYNPEKLNERLERSTIKLAEGNFAGNLDRFILENGARDFETALELARELSPVEEMRPAVMNTNGTQATSHDPNDGGPRPAGSATDGNTSSYWASSPTADNRTTPQTLTIEMAQAQSVGEVRYVPRLQNLQATGDIRRATLEYSLNGQDWTRVPLKQATPDGTITFIPGKPYHSILFEPVQAKYFRLTAHETYHWQNGSNGNPDNRNKIVAVAELTPVVQFVPEVTESLTTGYLLNAIDLANSIVPTEYSEAALTAIESELRAAHTALAGDSQEAINQANTRLRALLAGEEVAPVENPDSQPAEGSSLDLAALEEILATALALEEGSLSEAQAGQLAELVEAANVAKTGDSQDQVDEIVALFEEWLAALDSSNNQEGSGSQEGSGTAEGSGSQEGSGTTEGSGSQEGTGTTEGSGSQEGTGTTEGSGSQEGTGTTEGSGSQEGTGTTEGSGSQEGTGTVEGSGSQEGTGTTEGSGSQEGTGTAEGSGSQEGTGTTEGSGSQEGTGTTEGSGSQEGSGTAEGSGSQEGTGTTEGSGTTDGTDNHEGSGTESQPEEVTAKGESLLNEGPPAFEGGLTLNENLTHYLPAFEGGLVPNDAPTLQLPSLNPASLKPAAAAKVVQKEDVTDAKVLPNTAGVESVLLTGMGLMTLGAAVALRRRKEK
ncbi:discoidin domain-containing protein [Streptococcus suis]|uniref:discoidin domain-containing protein n=1 Tax=Streptococcus suis TaxID=1307 RepID=UPI001ABE00F8|nr:discoidin domain-containing protein [Streptococcus suis]